MKLEGHLGTKNFAGQESAHPSHIHISKRGFSGFRAELAGCVNEDLLLCLFPRKQGKIGKNRGIEREREKKRVAKWGLGAPVGQQAAPHRFDRTHF